MRVFTCRVWVDKSQSGLGSAVATGLKSFDCATKTTNTQELKKNKVKGQLPLEGFWSDRMDPNHQLITTRGLLSHHTHCCVTL